MSDPAPTGHPEQWLPVAGWPDYEVSDLGRVRRATWAPAVTRTYPGKVLRPSRAGRRYLQVTLHRHVDAVGERRDWLVHHLVAAAFLGPPPVANARVAFRNGDSADCRAANLEYTTAGRVLDRAYREGAKVARSGEAHHRARLTQAQADALRADPAPEAEAAARHGATRWQVYAIRTGRRWRPSSAK